MKIWKYISGKAPYTGKSGKTRYVASSEPREPRGLLTCQREEDREIAKKVSVIPPRGVKKKTKRVKLKNKSGGKASEKKFGEKSTRMLQ